jgi:hypothetical protein
LYRWQTIKEFEIASQVNSASLHPEQQVFVCGGEDFKMYKFDFTSGMELGEFLQAYWKINLMLNSSWTVVACISDH